MVAAIPTAGSSSSLQTILIRKITIEETPPPFDISAIPPYMSCGSSTPVTFTINNPIGVTGITGYSWNLGSANNNWLYNGNPAPQNISSSTNTLILTPVCGKVPNSVGGTVTLNGSNINTTNTGNFSYYQPGLSINGNSNICSGSSDYYINGLPCNANVTWSLSPASGVVSPSCLSCNQTTLTRQQSGTVTLTANINNACGQTLAPITKPISTVANTVIEGTYWLVLNGNWLDHGALDNSGYPKIVHVPSDQVVQYNITLTNTGLTGVSWTVSGPCTIVSSGDTYFNCTIPAPGKGSSGVTVTLHATGPCGTAINNPYSVSVLPLQSFTVSPNPATSSVKVTVSDNPIENSAATAGNSKTTATQRSITEIRIYDNTGILKKTQKENKTNQANVNLTGLKTGVYIVEITDGIYKERQQIIIQK